MQFFKSGSINCLKVSKLHHMHQLAIYSQNECHNYNFCNQFLLSRQCTVTTKNNHRQKIQQSQLFPFLLLTFLNYLGLPLKQARFWKQFTVSFQIWKYCILFRILSFQIFFMYYLVVWYISFSSAENLTSKVDVLWLFISNT